MNPLTLITALIPAFQVAAPIITQLIPQLSSAVGALSGTNPAAHSSVVTYLQEALNALGSAGIITLPKPLTVDGVFGGGTFGAIKLLQAKVGLSFLNSEPLATME